MFWIFFYLECRQFRVSIEFSLEHPEGGIQFVIPKGEGTMAQVVKKALYSLFVYFYVVLLMHEHFIRKATLLLITGLMHLVNGNYWAHVPLTF